MANDLAPSRLFHLSLLLSVLSISASSFTLVPAPVEITPGAPSIIDLLSVLILDAVRIRRRCCIFSRAPKAGCQSRTTTSFSVIFPFLVSVRLRYVLVNLVHHRLEDCVADEQPKPISKPESHALSGCSGEGFTRRSIV